MTTGEFDLILTSSTPSMQAVANANRDGKTKHVFGLVADPFSAGVGLDAKNPMKHPPYMVGQGTFLPVGDAFDLARRAFPRLQQVGVAWNPAESNSAAFTAKAREACARLGLTLLEANVDNSSAIVEAIHSLSSRGAQAIWVGGDNTMTSALATVDRDSAGGTDSCVHDHARRRGSRDPLRHGPRLPRVGPNPRPARGRCIERHGSGDDSDPRRPGTGPPARRHQYPHRSQIFAIRGAFRDDALAAADAVVDDTGVHEKQAAPRPAAKPTR